VIIKEAPNIDIRGFLTLCGERVLFATPPLTPLKYFQFANLRSSKDRRTGVR